MLPDLRRRAVRPALAAVTTTLLLTGLVSCGDDDSSGSAKDTESGGAAGYTPGTAKCKFPSDGQTPARPVDPPPATALATGQVPLTIELGQGTLHGTLDADKAPCNVSSFISLTKQGFYDDTPCPRVVSQGIFVLQCGDPTGTTGGGPGYNTPDEIQGDEKYTGGVLAAANIGQPNTGGSQFFVVYDTSPLNPDYTIFGTLDAASVAIVKKIAAAGDDGSNPAGGGKPNEAVEMKKVTIG